MPKLLSRDLWVPAADKAFKINPINRLVPARALLVPEFTNTLLVPEFADTQERIAVLTTKYWSDETHQLTVAFLDNPPTELRKRILSHMNAWGKTISIKFVASDTDPQVRVARVANDGHWSYVGTDILGIHKDLPTMNLDSFTTKTPDSEFRRVVRHETGHTLGCPHEHMRKELVELIDPEKAFLYYEKTQKWDRQMVQDQVLTPIEESSLLGTDHSDPNSIMCYHIPGTITKNEKPIIGGLDIDKSDYAFMGKIYPKSAAPVAQPKPAARSPKRPDYKEVLKQVEAIVGGVFPEGKLQNRLLNLGLREFLEEETIQRYGFPFRFLSQLDEAILTLAYYLHRFKEEGGKLHVYGLNKLSKGEDKTLSFWFSEKAKLYIEIQNMILLLNGFEGRESKVKRIFTFKNIADIAFLNQSAISAISEQRASKIKIGFLFTDTFKSSMSIEPISNTLIINFQPQNVVNEEKKSPNFYELYEVPGREKMHSLPYQQNCLSRWYRDEKEATKSTGVPPIERARARRLTALLQTFNKPWEEFGGGDQEKVHRFPRARNESRIGNEFFNSALVMMYKAYFDSPKLRSLPSDRADKIIDRFNERVVTQDLVRLERAMSTFDGDKWARIRAVDPTSVKNTLKLHESDPTYRHWLRRSLNHVLRKNSDAQLERVYIIEDTNASVDDEYDSLVRSMQYYLDYFHYEISELTGIANKHKEELQRKPQKWEAEMWVLLKNRVKIYVTTRSVLKDFWCRLPGRDRDPLGKMLDEFASDSLQSSDDPFQLFTTLDYLFTDDMIYAFDNPRADPGELNFNAYLLRKSFDVGEEEDILFNFTNEEMLQPLVRQQKIQRMTNVMDSITEYKRAYQSIAGFREEFRKLEKRIAPIRKRLTSLPVVRRDSANGSNALDEHLEKHPEILDDYPSDLLLVRREAETMLFDHFAPKVDYFFNLLRYMSVEVKFFDNIETLDVRKVYPFSQIGGSAAGRAPKKPGAKLAKLIIKNVESSRDNFPLPPQPRAVPANVKQPTTSANLGRPAAATAPIKILLLGANPVGTPFAHLSEEFHRIRRSIEFGRERDRFYVKEDAAARRAELQENLLNFKPTVVHFSGHTGPERELLLMDDNGHPRPVSVSALKAVFQTLGRDIQCVVINACSSRQFAEAIAAHVDCTIGMSAAIKDFAAINFAASFYGALAYGESVRTAFDVGCNQLKLEGLPGADIPELFCLKRDPKNIFLLSQPKL